MSRWAPWLLALVAVVIAELAWGVVEWTVFLVRRKRIKEDIRVLLTGKGRTGRRLGVLVLAGAALLCVGCGSSQTKGTGQHSVSSMMTRRIFTLKGVGESVDAIVRPVSDALPPLVILEDVVLNVQDDTLEQIVTPIVWILAP